MKIRQSFTEIRNGFHPTFWVANGMELFERLAYYGQATVLSIFLRDHLHFNEIEAGEISSVFGGLLWMFPIVAGTLADKFGFRRAFSVAFAMLAIGYFLIGTTGMTAFAGVYNGLPLYWVLIAMFIFTAIGGSFIKPSVLGTVAATSRPETKSLGYAVYYWLVNIGGATGPAIAFFVRDTAGIAYVYLVSSMSCAAMFLVNAFFYKNVEPTEPIPVESLLTKFRNLIVVLSNWKFMVFLIIFSLYWIMFWQIYIVIPFYITDYISKDAPFEIIQSTGAWGIIALQLVVNRLTKRLPTGAALVAGFATCTVSWLLIALHPSVWVIVGSLLVWSLGEMTQAPRYYEYISGLAPRGQQGLFQGFGFLPIAIAWLVGGPFGGWLYATFAKTSHPSTVWYSIFAVGVAATVLMAVYNKFVVMHDTNQRTA
ncbi:MAG: MFS transporter [Bacteroidota bacterium]